MIFGLSRQSFFLPFLVIAISWFGAVSVDAQSCNCTFCLGGLVPQDPRPDPNGPQFFQLSGFRWTQTATNGPGIQRGDPITLTWGFARELTGSTFIPNFGPGTGAGANSNLIARMDQIYGSGPGGTNLTLRPWFQHYQSVFNRWSELSGITYVYEANDDGLAFNDLNQSQGVLGVRADIRIGGRSIDGNNGVLGFNFYPLNGEMVIDTNDSFFNNTNNNSRRLRNVVAHEHGHGLGFAHVIPTNQTKLMEPAFTGSFDGPQLDDILALHRNYGDRLEKTNGGLGNDTAGTAYYLGSVTNITASIGNHGSTVQVSPTQSDFVSIDGTTDVDYFRFSVDGKSLVDIVLTPQGPTYNQGPQGGSSAPFNAAAQNDLMLTLFAQDGTTILAHANATGLGGSEVISYLVNAAGSYFVRVMGSVDAVQLYRLQITGGLVIPEPAGGLVLLVFSATALLRRRRTAR
ncbi:MAG TPA: matrixin family metalloprotease [Pirellulaceae bacterium]|nr:matrixin family metalloprotease [Pirellulaceae bacterium]